MAEIAKIPQDSNILDDIDLNYSKVRSIIGL